MGGTAVDNEVGWVSYVERCMRGIGMDRDGFHLMLGLLYEHSFAALGR